MSLNYSSKKGISNTNQTVHARDKKLAFDNQVHTIEFSRTRHSPYRPNQWPSEKQSNNQNQTIPVNRKQNQPGQQCCPAALRRQGNTLRRSPPRRKPRPKHGRVSTPHDPKPHPDREQPATGNRENPSTTPKQTRNRAISTQTLAAALPKPSKQGRSVTTGRC